MGFKLVVFEFAVPLASTAHIFFRTSVCATMYDMLKALLRTGFTLVDI